MIFSPTDKQVETFWSHVDLTGDCWLWTRCRCALGYGKLGFRVSGYPRVQLAHRFAYLLANPKEDISGRAICHRCDVPACVNPAHLFVGSWSDNNADKGRKGRQARGCRIGMARLTESAVSEIRKSHRDGVHLSALAKRFGVDPSTVSVAARGLTWTHVT